MPPTKYDVIEISDTESESEGYSQLSSSQPDLPPSSSQPGTDIEVLDISDSEEEASPSPTRLSKFSDPTESYLEISDDDEFPELNVALSQSSFDSNLQFGTRKRDRTYSSGSSTGYTPDSSPSKRSRTSRTSSFDDLDADWNMYDNGGQHDATLDTAAEISKTKRCTLLTAEEKKKLEAEEKKRRKEQDRADKLAVKEVQKVENATFRKANTLKTSKRDVLPCMKILFSDTLLSQHPELLQHLDSKMAQEKTKVSAMTRVHSQFGTYKTIRWKKQHTETFNQQERQWEPCEEFERVALLWLDAADVNKELHNLKTVVKEFRERHNLVSRKDQTFIMFFGKKRDMGVDSENLEFVLSGLE
ncbi:hypothetical protein L218DRAFT_988136, partial [Marasmius fiardii PR-910]